MFQLSGLYSGGLSVKILCWEGVRKFSLRRWLMHPSDGTDESHPSNSSPPQKLPNGCF